MVIADRLWRSRRLAGFTVTTYDHLDDAVNIRDGSHRVGR